MTTSVVCFVSLQSLAHPLVYRRLCWPVSVHSGRSWGWGWRRADRSSDGFLCLMPVVQDLSCVTEVRKAKEGKIHHALEVLVAWVTIQRVV